VADSSTVAIDDPTSVYQYRDEYDVLIYVGVTKRATTRQAEHTSKAWWPLVASQSVEHYPTRALALEREEALIKEQCPPFNTIHNRLSDIHRMNYETFRATVVPGGVVQIATQLGHRIPLFFTGERMDGPSRLATYSTDPRHFTLAQAVVVPSNQVLFTVNTRRVGHLVALTVVGPRVDATLMVRKDVELPSLARMRVKTPSEFLKNPQVVPQSIYYEAAA
jgi:predicted GIY-YIG superfamily endonuclease